MHKVLTHKLLKHTEKLLVLLIYILDSYRIHAQAHTCKLPIQNMNIIRFNCRCYIHNCTNAEEHQMTQIRPAKQITRACSQNKNKIIIKLPN